MVLAAAADAPDLSIERLIFGITRFGNSRRAASLRLVVRRQRRVSGQAGV
jgi:hypothetical protein